MKIKIYSIGTKMPDWVYLACNEYIKRVQPLISVQLQEIPMAKRGKNDSAADIAKYCQLEGKALLEQVGVRDYMVALEVGGRSFSTEKLAQHLQQWQQQGDDVVLVIGGPDGLSDEVKKAAKWHWSLSDLTLPHPMVRVILVEQLYRSASLNAGHPYHRA